VVRLHRVERFDDMKDVLGQFDADSPDLVLLDWQLGHNEFDWNRCGSAAPPLLGRSDRVPHTVLEGRGDCRERSIHEYSPWRARSRLSFERAELDQWFKKDLEPLLSEAMRRMPSGLVRPEYDNEPELFRLSDDEWRTLPLSEKLDLKMDAAKEIYPEVDEIFTVASAPWIVVGGWPSIVLEVGEDGHLPPKSGCLGRSRGEVADTSPGSPSSDLREHRPGRADELRTAWSSRHFGSRSS